MKHSRHSALSREQLEELDLDLHYWAFELIDRCSHIENWFAGIVQKLLGTDETRAMIVWNATLNSRARVQLMLSLANVSLLKNRRFKHLEKLCEEYRALNRTRNFLAHSLCYSDKWGFVEYMAYHNPEKLKPGPHTSYIDYRVIDRGFTNEIRDKAKTAMRLGGRLKRFVASLGAAGEVRARRAELTQRQVGLKIAKQLHLRRGKRPKPKRRDQSSRER